MELSESLTGQLYVFAYASGHTLRIARTERDYLLRAAVVADLQLRGRLVDHAGRVQVSSREPVGEPVLDAVLAEITESKPRPWRRWVQRNHRAFRRTVQNRLVTLGLITVQSRRILGVVTLTRVSLREPAMLTGLVRRVQDALTSAQPVSDVDAHDAALVALAATAGLTTVLPRQLRRAHKQRIAEMAERTGPVVAALHKAIRVNRAAAHAVAGG